MASIYTNKELSSSSLRQPSIDYPPYLLWQYIVSVLVVPSFVGHDSLRRLTITLSSHGIFLSGRLARLRHHALVSRLNRAQLWGIGVRVISFSGWEVITWHDSWMVVALWGAGVAFGGNFVLLAIRENSSCYYYLGSPLLVLSSGDDWMIHGWPYSEEGKTALSVLSPGECVRLLVRIFHFSCFSGYFILMERKIRWILVIRIRNYHFFICSYRPDKCLGLAWHGHIVPQCYRATLDWPKLPVCSTQNHAF